MSTNKKHISLFLKFSFSMTTIILIFGGINEVLVTKKVGNSLQAEYEKRGVFIAKSIINQATNMILYEDYVSLQNLISSTKSSDSSIYYIFIHNAQNQVLCHTFAKNLPDNLLQSNINEAPIQAKFERIVSKSDNSKILDLSYPVFEGKIGFLRIGISEESIQSNVREAQKVFLIMIISFLFIGILGAFIISRFITDPLKNIENTIDKINFQNPPFLQIEWYKNRIAKEIPIWKKNDEIDMLVTKFNEMLFRLENAHDELQKTQKILIHSEKLATVGKMTANFAHEINNPIAGIKNCLRRLKSDPTNYEQSIRYIDLMNEATEKIEFFISNLLNFTRKEGKVTLSFVPLTEILNNSLKFLFYKLNKQNISFEADFNNTEINLFCNAQQLEQVFVNLILNSMDAIEEKSLNVGSNFEKKILFKAKMNKDYCQIEIEDNGCGMEQSVIEKIYEPFFTTKSKQAGTGLGMAIVLNIINIYKGNINIVSKKGEFTRFEIIFPLSNSQL